MEPGPVLASAGVPLYAACDGSVPSADPALLADLLVSLQVEGGAAGAASIPCLLARHDAVAAEAVARAAVRLDAVGRARLVRGLRISRALCVSRAPDLRRLLGRVPRPGALPLEPADLPGAEEDHGERLLAVAAEEEERGGGPRATGDAVRAFDTWLRILAAEGSP